MLKKLGKVVLAFVIGTAIPTAMQSQDPEVRAIASGLATVIALFVRSPKDHKD